MPQQDDRQLPLTTAGDPVGDDQNTLTAGDPNPVLMQDWQLTEKLAHQNPEMALGRVVYAKGLGAYGTLEITGDVSNEPDSSSGSRQESSFIEPPLSLYGPVARFDRRDSNDDFSQPRALFARFDDGQKARLYFNVAATIKDVPASITERQLELFRQVHPEYGAGVCAALDVLDPQF